jgi:Tol biopolymer transport system component
MPADGSGDLTPLIPPANEDEGFFNPVWSPDGSYVYYSRYIHDPSNAKSPIVYDMGRVAFPDGQPETLLQDAIWPRLSGDGTRLAYVSYSTSSSKTNLMVSAPDGSGSQPILAEDAFAAVDAPLFTPDGNSLYFSAVGPGPSASLSWWDRLLGVIPAEAHNVPSDWWSVSLSGNDLRRLTSIASTGMFADLSPDKTKVAFGSSTGIYVMNADGSGLSSLLNVFATGGLSWLP